jgi:hypothetical protein
MGSSAYRKAARTFRAIQAGRLQTQGSTDTSRAVGGSVFQSYTISRENSFSPDEEEVEAVLGVRPKEELGEVSDDSGTGRSTGLSRPDSLASSAPKEALARELLRAATTKNLARPEMATLPRTNKRKQWAEEDVEVVEVQTVGQLQQPSFHISSSMLHSVPLGSVPGRSESGAATAGHPSLGLIPGQAITEQHHSNQIRKGGSDYDETEPLGQVTTTARLGAEMMDTENPLSSARGSGLETDDFDDTEPLTNTTSSLAWDAWEPSLQGGHPGLGSVPGGHPGLGSVPGGHPGFGSLPTGLASTGGHPGLGSLPGLGPPSLGSSSLTTIQCGLTSALTSSSLSACRPSALSIDHCWSETEAELQAGAEVQCPVGEPSKGRGVSKYNDSGVMSGEYSEDVGGQGFNIDAMSDGGFSDVCDYPGIRVASKESSEPLSLEVESALRHLNPADVERRRKLMGRNYR